MIKDEDDGIGRINGRATHTHRPRCNMRIVLTRIVGNLTIVCAFDAYPFRIRLLKIGGGCPTNITTTTSGTKARGVQILLYGQSFYILCSNNKKSSPHNSTKRRRRKIHRRKSITMNEWMDRWMDAWMRGRHVFGANACERERHDERRIQNRRATIMRNMESISLRIRDFIAYHMA